MPCPICIIAVTAGVGLSRWLGIDDTISGVWIGALTVAISMWTVNWLKKKHLAFKWMDVVVLLAYYAMVIIPMEWTGLMGHSQNRLWGIDKIMFGFLIGSIALTAGVAWYDDAKKKNNGKAHFPFEKVVAPIAPLILFSLIFYLLTR